MMPTSDFEQHVRLVPSELERMLMRRIKIRTVEGTGYDKSLPDRGRLVVGPFPRLVILAGFEVSRAILMQRFKFRQRLTAT